MCLNHVGGWFSETQENWSFQGLSEANLCVLEPRVFPPKPAKHGQGFPNLDNDSHPGSFTFTLHLHSSHSPKHLFNTKYNIA